MCLWWILPPKTHRNNINSNVMRTIILGLLCSIMSFQCYAQLLASAEDAKKAVKVVMLCSGYSEKDHYGTKDNKGDFEISIQKIGNNFTLSISPTQETFDLPNSDYRKIVTDKLMEKEFVVFHREDTVANATFKYHSEVSNTGIVECSFSILTATSTRTFSIEKCIFITKDGLAHNYYRDRANSLDSDLMSQYFEAMKIKNGKASGISSFFDKVKKKGKNMKDKIKNKKKNQDEQEESKTNSEIYH